MTLFVLFTKMILPLSFTDFASNYLVRSRWLCFIILTLFLNPLSYAYSTQAPQVRIEVGQHTGMINRMSINQEGSLLATVSDDKTLRLWTLPSGNAYATLRVPIGENLQGALYAVALSPDGKTVITAGETGNAKDKFSLYVFDVEQRVLKARIAELPASIYHLSFSKDGRQFAAAFAGGFGIKVWDSQTGKLIAEDTDYRERSTWLDFNQAGQLATVSQDGQVRLYSRELKLLKQATLQAQGIPYSIQFSPDQTQLAIGYSNLPQIDLVDKQLNKLRTLTFDHLTARNAALVQWQSSQAGTAGILAAGTMHNAQGEYVIRHWPDSAHPERYEDSAVSRNIITDLIALPTSPEMTVDTLFASAEPSWGGLKQGQLIYKNQAELWDSRVVELPEKVFKLAPDGLQVAFTLDEHSQKVGLFDIRKLNFTFIQDQAQIQTLTPAITQSPEIRLDNWQRSPNPAVNKHVLKLDDYERTTTAAIDPNSAQVLIGSNYHLRWVNAAGEILAKVTVPAEVNGLSIAREGQLAVAALGDGTLRWYSLNPKEMLTELVALFPYAQGKSWIIWTPEGFFANTDGGGHELAGYQLNQGDNKRPEWLSFTQLYQAYYAPELILPKLLRQEQLLQERLKSVDTASHRVREKPVPTVQLLEYCIDPQVLATKAFTREKSVPVQASPDDTGLFSKLENLLQRLIVWLHSMLSPSASIDKPSVPSAAPILAKAETAPTCYALNGEGNTRAFAREPTQVKPAIYRNQFDRFIPAVTLRYRVQTRAGGLGDIDVYVNDQIQQTRRELSANQNPTESQEFSQLIKLGAGANQIVINAYEQSGGTAAQSALIALQNPVEPNPVAETEERPKIIVFSVGINAYAAPNQLAYAVKDARDFLNTVTQFKSDRYSQVLTFDLMDEQATLTNIETTFDKIAQVVAPKDTVLVYFSGHGLKEAMDFYFIPQDVDDNNLAMSALSQRRLKSNIAKLAKTNHIFVFIDSCHSGAVDLANIEQEMSSFDKIRQQLGENIFILAASGENQEAQDQFKLDGDLKADNGLFAYAVIEGLKGKARRIDDNVVDNYNLGTYVQRRIDALTKNQSLYKQKARFQMLEAGDVLTFDITKYN